MSEFNLVSNLFESDLRSRIDCLHRLLDSDLSMQIVYSIKPGTPRYRRYFLLRHSLHSKFHAYLECLNVFRSACAHFDNNVAI